MATDFTTLLSPNSSIRGAANDAKQKIDILRAGKFNQQADVFEQTILRKIQSKDPSILGDFENLGQFYGANLKREGASEAPIPSEDLRKKKAMEASTAASISAVNSLMDRSLKSGNKIDPGLVQTITELAKYDPDKAMKLAESSMPILEVKEDTAPKKTEANITFEQNAAAALRYADSLSDAINKYGTSETVDPAGSAILGQLPYQMAISYAKLVDPTSVAREGEVASAEKYLIPLGMFTREDTAKEALKNFRADIVSRIDQYKKSTGKEIEIESKTKPEPVKTQQPTVTSSNTYFNKFSQPYPQSPTR
jgi:hypothetical protein